MSTFRTKWKLTPGTQPRMVQRLKTFLFNELLRDKPQYLDGDWCRTHYYKLFTPMQMLWKDQCNINNRSWQIDINNNEDYDQETLDEYISNLIIPVAIKNKIESCQTGNKRFVVILIKIFWPNNGHAACMVFDLEDKLQWYFDPDDWIEKQVSFGVAFSQKSFLTGFTAVSCEHVT
jgi:hypothetical protein